MKFQQKGKATIKLTFGTLGCLATENVPNGKKVLLSNYHVLYAMNEDNVHHPDYSACKSHRIGVRMRHAPTGTPQAPGTADAAIAKLTKPDKADPVIVDIGEVRGTEALTLKASWPMRTNPTASDWATGSGNAASRPW